MCVTADGTQPASEAQALQARMALATGGAGTDDEAVRVVAERTAAAHAELQRLSAAPGDHQQRIRELGKVEELLTEGSEFLGLLHGDVGEEEFQGFGRAMGVGAVALAKRQILDAIGTFTDDEAAVYRAIESIHAPLTAEEARLPPTARPPCSRPRRPSYARPSSSLLR